MDWGSPGAIGGIAGGVMGLLGGLFGTYCSIKNTRGPRERAYMIKAAITCWILVSLYIAVSLALPGPYKILLMLPYALILPLAIYKGNKTQSRIRQEESGSNN